LNYKEIENETKYAPIGIFFFVVASSAGISPFATQCFGKELTEAQKMAKGHILASKAPEPADNISNPAKVELGKQLFFDPRLS
jgi:cytochrome c peroxidase